MNTFLSEAVEGGGVLDLLARRHHHSPLHGVDRVGRHAGRHGDSPAQEERVQPGVGVV